MRTAIVGGGIVGLAVAWQMARAGHDVTIYDAQAESREASWAAAGMLAPHNEASDGDALWNLCCASYAQWPAFLDALGCSAEDLDFRSNGSLIPLMDGDCRLDIERKVRWLEAAGVAVEQWNRAQIQQREPHIGAHIRELIHVPGGQVNPRIVCRVLRERCAQLGVTLAYRCPVAGISHGTVALEDGRSVQFDHVVVAAGAWTPRMADMTGVAIQGEPVKGQLLAFDTSIRLNHFIHCSHAYCVSRAGQGMVIGASVEHVGFDRQDNQGAIAQLMAGAQRLIPALSTARVAETWTGLRPRINGGLPLFARINDHLSICSGHFRNGILLTPISASIMEALVTGTQPPIDVTPFTAGALVMPA